MDTAAKNKFHNFVHQPSDLYKLEVSFIHRPEEQTVILILHVLFVETENLLPLFKFISLPIYFNFSPNISVIPDVGKADLNAIGNTKAFQTLSTSDLANCKRLGSMFFCDGRSVLQTNIIENCLGSLPRQLLSHQSKLQIPHRQHQRKDQPPWQQLLGRLLHWHHCDESGLLEGQLTHR
jgi:hypothetical protein